MRLEQPRITPLTADEMDPEQRAMLESVLGAAATFNIFRTLARAPEAMKRFNQWAGYVLSDRNSLSARERELVILRTGFLCGAGYEWAQHEVIGKRVGLTEDEIERIKQGPDAEGWSDLDAALLRATDDLVGAHFISDGSWQALDSLSERQKMDLVFTVGQYTQVSMMLNSFGVQLDEGLTLDPDLKR